MGPGYNTSDFTISPISSQISSFVPTLGSSITSSPGGKFSGLASTGNRFTSHAGLHTDNIYQPEQQNFLIGNSDNQRSYTTTPNGYSQWPRIPVTSENTNNENSCLQNPSIASTDAKFLTATSKVDPKYNTTRSKDNNQRNSSSRNKLISMSSPTISKKYNTTSPSTELHDESKFGSTNGLHPGFNALRGSEIQSYNSGVSTININDKHADASEKAKFATSDDFETMVGDLRRTFIGWLKRTDSELRREKERIRKAKIDLENDRAKCLQELERQKEMEYDRIKEERVHFNEECANAAKQIVTEREDARSKISEERKRFDLEKEQSRRKLLQERDKFREEFDSFEAERRRIVDSKIATETMVEINVGGVQFQSARNTLTQQPGSYLASLFSGRHKVSRDRNGCIFIDRDSEIFRSILNFLREPSTPPCPKDASYSESLCKEAKHYGVRFYPYPLVFACGGHNGVDYLRSVELLDVSLQCWRPCQSMETERTHFGGAVANGRIELFGGQNLDYKALCDAESYDILRDTWMPAPPLNVARRNPAGLAFDDRIYAIGGFDGSSILQSVEAYDHRMKGWMEVASLNVPRSSPMTVAHGDSLYVLGGTRGERLRTIESFDVKMNKWITFEPDMIEVRSAGCAASVCGELLVFGGTDGSHKIHASIESFGPESERWIFRKSMKEPRMDASCVVISESVLVCGGQHGDVVNTTEFYRPSLDAWQHGPNMLSPRYGHVTVLANL